MSYPRHGRQPTGSLVQMFRKLPHRIQSNSAMNIYRVCSFFDPVRDTVSEILFAGITGLRIAL